MVSVTSVHYLPDLIASYKDANLFVYQLPAVSTSMRILNSF